MQSFPKRLAVAFQSKIMQELSYSVFSCQVEGLGFEVTFVFVNEIYGSRNQPLTRPAIKIRMQFQDILFYVIHHIFRAMKSLIKSSFKLIILIQFVFDSSPPISLLSDNFINNKTTYIILVKHCLSFFHEPLKIIFWISVLYLNLYNGDSIPICGITTNPPWKSPLVEDKSALLNNF
jgi:hypothetical protein